MEGATLGNDDSQPVESQPLHVSYPPLNFRQPDQPCIRAESAITSGNSAARFESGSATRRTVLMVMDNWSSRSDRVPPARWDSRAVPVLILHPEMLDDLFVHSQDSENLRVPALPARGRRVLIGAATCAWLAAVVGGTTGLLAYAGRMGAAASASEAWPADSDLARDPLRRTLITFLHPHCPCSRATLGNLARAIARAGDGLAAQIVIVSPPGADESWVKSGLWQTAVELGFDRIVLDRNGRNARLFGAETSGQTFVYDAAGRLQFSGGLTPARGHEGDCDGTDAILSCARGREFSISRTPVFGCALHGRRGAAVRPKSPAGGQE